MLQPPDIATLRLCSILASAAFGLVFACLWGGRKNDSYLAHWSASSFLYALVLIGFHLAPASSVLLAGSLFGLLAATNMLLVSGARCFEGEPPFRAWMMAPVAAAAIGHAAPATLLPLWGFEEAAATRIGETLGLACSMTLAGVFLMLKPVTEGRRGRSIAGSALLAYVPGYLIVILAEFQAVPTPNLIALVPMLSDQLLLGVLNLGLLAMPAERAQERLRQAALRDPLTGAWNRAGLEARAAHLLAPGATVIAIDVDHFKLINDRDGHAAGDSVLVHLAREAGRLSAAEGGELARIGGDEFVAILPVHNAHGSLALAERLRSISRRATVGLPTWTISIGMAPVQPGEGSLSAALKRADASLYRAKSLGRDQVAA